MEYLIQKLIAIPVLIISFTLHEIAHGLAAFVMGDKTAKNSGRLSLNPLKHIDWLGFLMLLVARIGWAKPVPVDAYGFKDPKKGMAITALAGPLMNVVLVFVSLIFWHLGKNIYDWNEYVTLFFELSVYYNAVLAMFNLLPIPPLDGSKVLLAFLPSKYYFKFMEYEQYGMIVILILAFTNVSSKIISVGVENLIGKLEKIVMMILGVS